MALPCRLGGRRAGYLPAVRGWAGAAAPRRRPGRYQAVPDAPQEVHCYSWADLTALGRGGGGIAREGRVEVAKERLLSRGTRRRRGQGKGWGVARRQKGRSHARDGRSEAKLKVLAALLYPVLGRWLQNRWKSDVPVFCKALSWARSISINFSLELFSQQTDASSLPGGTEVSWCSCEALAGGCWEFSLFAHFNSQSSSPRGARSPPPSRAESPGVVPWVDMIARPTVPQTKGSWDATTNLVQTN